MTEQRYTELLDRDVTLRTDGSDREVWDATFNRCYHVPPDTMPVPATVLDLGANIGLTCAHYKSLWTDATVVGVEMDSECATLAQENAPDCTIYCAAVTGTGDSGFYDSAVWPSNFSFSHTGGTATDSLTLGKIIKTAFGGPVDFVKMDVEGAEWGIFANGEWAPLVRHLLVELHGDEDAESMVERAIWMLNKLGFQARHHTVHPQAVWAWR